ncbi:MAG TPA: threonine--tRNA ligase [Polyangiaceae bacterium]|nr:threonine--tRNA ligase [Polyangiaceae bacterium]
MSEAIDHRDIAREQDLFHFQEDAPGMVFWHARGLALCRALEQAARAVLCEQEYAEVRSPQLLPQPIWEASGHWQHFAEGMFKLREEDGRGLALRPVNCPGHAQIYRSALRSHRDLPLRLAEFGVVHRKEPSGALQGLFRLRQFLQDDGHIFCRPDQLAEELERFCRSLQLLYRGFGFEQLAVGLSRRPPERLGSDASWDVAERALEQAARGLGSELWDQPGEGAFYGPKLEFKLRDRCGRIWQCGTIQVDFALPERFALEYVDAGGQRRRPAMLHRALYGSVERFLGILLEHYQGRLPAWLAPEQARVFALGADQLERARSLLAALRAAGLRASLDVSDERLGSRIARARQLAIPFLLCVGAREARAGVVSVRHGEQRSELELERAIAELAQACAPPFRAA